MTSPDELPDCTTITFAQLARKQMRSPHDIPHQSMMALVQQWSEARSRSVLAKHSHVSDLVAEDLFAELAYGARIAQEATAGQWCAVADLLRAGAVESWAQVGAAMDMTETEAHEGFHDWIARQVYLHKTSATLGITETEAKELYEAEALGTEDLRNLIKSQNRTPSWHSGRAAVREVQ